MAVANEQNSTGTPRSVVSRVGSAIRDSTMLLLVAVGIAQIAFAGVVQLLLSNDIIGRDANLSGVMLDLFGDGNLWGLWAAVFTIWGGGLVFVGAVGYSFIWWRRR